VNAGKSAQFDLRYDTAIASHATFIGAVKVTSTSAVGMMVQTRGSGGTGDALMAFQGLMP
jgi:carbonic anhydrase/acetyltransferase-like protein (isoleucine patch superfamily)